MKVFGLFLMLSLIAVMTGMLTAMSADASARLSLVDKSRLSTPMVTVADGARNRLSETGSTSVSDQSLKVETPRKNAKKRSRSKCARVTSTCWGKP